MRRPWIAFALAAVGCGGSPAPVNLVGVDTSGSAQEFRVDFERAVRDVNESVPPGDRYEIYRFDTRADEVYVGGSLDARPFKETLERALSINRGQKGTNLRPLIERFDERMRAYPDRKFRLLICTDCGVELMRPEDHAAVRAIASTWASSGRVERCTVTGLRPLHRDALRADLGALGDRLELR